jgi:hypothetical protein
MLVSLSAFLGSLSSLSFSLSFSLAFSVAFSVVYRGRF